MSKNEESVGLGADRVVFLRLLINLQHAWEAKNGLYHFLSIIKIFVDFLVQMTKIIN